MVLMVDTPDTADEEVEDSEASQTIFLIWGLAETQQDINEHTCNSVHIYNLVDIYNLVGIYNPVHFYNLVHIYTCNLKPIYTWNFKHIHIYNFVLN